MRLRELRDTNGILRSLASPDSVRRTDLGGAGKPAGAGIGGARAREGWLPAAVERSGFEKR